MIRILSATAFVLAALTGCTAAAPAPGTGETPLRELSASGVVGQTHRWTVPENGTTGYLWTADFNARDCKVQIEHRAGAEGLCGAPGTAVVAVTPLKPGPCMVTLRSVRSFEPEKPPVETIRCVLRARAR